MSDNTNDILNILQANLQKIRVSAEINNAQKLYEALYFESQLMDMSQTDNIERLWNNHWEKSSFWRGLEDDPVSVDVFLNWADWLKIFWNISAACKNRDAMLPHFKAISDDIGQALSLADRVKNSLPEIFEEQYLQKGRYMIFRQKQNLYLIRGIIFAYLKNPVEIARDFYELTEAVKKEDVSTFSFNSEIVFELFGIWRNFSVFLQIFPALSGDFDWMLSACVDKLENNYKITRSVTERTCAANACRAAAQIMRDSSRHSAAEIYSQRADAIEKA